MKKISSVFFLIVFLSGLAAVALFVTDGKLLGDYANAYYTGGATAPYRPGATNYGLLLAAAALIAVIAAGVVAARGRTPDWDGVACFGAVSVVAGLALSRLIYCATEFSFYSMDTAGLPAVARIWEGGVCMTGAILGGVVGALVTAKRTREKAWINAVAVAALFAAIARLGEQWTHTGYGDYAQSAHLFTFADAYGDPVVNVWLIETLIALGVFASMLFYLKRERGAYDGLLMFFLLYGTAQLVAESLKFDGQMCWGFVKAQQLYAMLMAAAATLVLGVHAKRFWLALAVSLAASGAFVLLGFALDRWDVPSLTLYAFFVAAQAAYIAFGLWLMRRAARVSANESVAR